MSAADEGVRPVGVRQRVMRLSGPCPDVLGDAVPGVDHGEVLQDLRALVHDFADADDPQGLSEGTERQLREDGARGPQRSPGRRSRR